VTNSAAVNLLKLVSMCTIGRIIRSQAVHTTHFSRSYQSAFQSNCINIYSWQACIRRLLLHVFASHQHFQIIGKPDRCAMVSPHGLFYVIISRTEDFSIVIDLRFLIYELPNFIFCPFFYWVFFFLLICNSSLYNLDTNSSWLYVLQLSSSQL
jgi:hypothetical protein